MATGSGKSIKSGDYTATPPALAKAIDQQQTRTLAYLKRRSACITVSLTDNITQDGNQRTSRIMQTAALVQENTRPLFFNDRLIDQNQRATIMYYETGEYTTYNSCCQENYDCAFEVNRKTARHQRPARPGSVRRLPVISGFTLSVTPPPA